MSYKHISIFSLLMERKGSKCMEKKNRREKTTRTEYNPHHHHHHHCQLHRFPNTWPTSTLYSKHLVLAIDSLLLAFLCLCLSVCLSVSLSLFLSVCIYFKKEQLDRTIPTWKHTERGL